MLKILFILFSLLFFATPLAFAESYDVGTIYWKQDIISSNSFAEIYVKDDDMNKKEYPNFADDFTISVWSDTSTNPLTIKVVETGVYSGIFKGSVYIADSGPITSNRLISSPGDILYAKYLDFTLPEGGSSEIIAAAVVKISGKNMVEVLNNIDPSMRSGAHPENKIPSWVKNNAGWWADGTITESEFISGIEFLITDGIINVPPTTVSSETSDGVPAWVKNNAGWWADGIITDGEFVNGIQHLIKSGLILVSVDSEPIEITSIESNHDDPQLTALEVELEKCSKILKSYKRIDCEKPIDKAIMLYKYKTDAQHFDLGPITYHWFGIGSEGNQFEISSTGQAILSVRMLAENTSSEITAMNCTSPSICAYDVWDGSKAFKYSGMDFTSGQIVLNPGDTREFNILFGPNIGYGGTEFEYDSSKSYIFRINEPFGSTDIPLNLE
jgi:hypothetical protein